MKNFKTNKIRNHIQLLILLLIVVFIAFNSSNPEAYCPFGGIQAISNYSINNSLACDMATVQITLGILMLIAVVILGKLFCSYLCPLGYAAELLYKLRKWLNIKEVVVVNGSFIDKMLRSIKYILLFVIFYFSISSSELFCKQFDPYYALTTGLKGEINLWLSMTAIYMLLFGSLFIRMFWCKYICPLGAVSNIFKYFLSAMTILLIYYILFLLKIRCPWQLLLALMCIIGYLNEIFYKHVKIFPLLKIKRDKTKCIENCRNCVIKCPYNISINKSDIVKHVDCTMCGDCVAECKNSALSINGSRKIRLIIPVVITMIFLTGIHISNKWEVPMTNLKWGSYSSGQLEKFEIKGLRSIKCYSSSMNFAKKIQKIKGVYGVKTYIQHHRVEILYNPHEISIDDIRKNIYSPVKFKISRPDKSVKEVKVITIHTENMTDPIDVNYLGMQFRMGKRKYYGLTSEYSKPLTIRLYTDLAENVDANYIRQVVEMKEMAILMHGGKVKKEKVNFMFINIEERTDTISKRKLLELLFRPYKKMFKDNFDEKNISVYDVVYPDIEKPMVARNLPYLANYLSLNKEILGLETTLNNEDEPVIRVYYSTINMDGRKIWNYLTQKKWMIKEKNGNAKEMEPAISFIKK